MIEDAPSMGAFFLLQKNVSVFLRGCQKNCQIHIVGKIMHLYYNDKRDILHYVN